MKAILFNIQKFSLHDGFGIRTTLFFKGCNLRCQWCANPESQRMEPEQMNGQPCGKEYSLEEIIKEVMKDKPFYDQSGGGVTLSGGEPLLQWEFADALSKALHARGVSVGIETAAAVPSAHFQTVFQNLDFAHIDLKHYDSAKHKAATGVGNEQILENIRYALACPIPVILRIPVIPGYNDSLTDMAAFRSVLRRLGVTRVQLLPFHQLGENKYNQLNKAYAYQGVSQLHDADLEERKQVLERDGLLVQIGG